MNEYDVVVCGAGPGGSTAARELARRGRRVLMLDRARFPRVKICAGWVTPGIFHLLRLHPDQYPHTLQEFDSGSVVLGDRYYESTFGETVSYGIIRQEFDDFLARRAESAGVEFKEGVNIQKVERDGGVARLTTREGASFVAPVVIGAGGTGCPVARSWGEKRKEEVIVVATESETRLGADLLKKLTPYYGTAELFPESDYTGYAWYVTKGDWLNIGIGRYRHRTKNLNTERERFWSQLRSLGRLEGIEDRLATSQGHSYALYDDTPRRLFGDNFVLIGDAGGFATRWVGEGIKPAVQTGLFAAGCVDGALTAGDVSAAKLSGYKQACDELYGPQKRSGSERLIRALPESLKFTLARQIMKRDSLRRRFVFEFAFGFEPARVNEIPAEEPARIMAN